MNAFQNELTNTIAVFIRNIGIEVTAGTLTDDTFLPGIKILRGGLVVDELKLKFPGDLLHEAGHLAVAPANLRSALSDEVNLEGINMDVIESMAIGWSYAAAVHLGLDPSVVFHSQGYKGKSEQLLFNFRIGVFIGAAGLAEAQMTAIGATAQSLNVPAYPHMLKWLRE